MAETLACGTGACAVAVAANEAGLAPRRTLFGSREGRSGRSPTDGVVVLTGAVEHVFDGVVDLDGLRVRSGVTDPQPSRTRGALAARTLDLVEVPAESRDEAALLALRGPRSGGPRVADEATALRFSPPARDGRGFVVLAGHVDTVPPTATSRPVERQTRSSDAEPLT